MGEEVAKSRGVWLCCGALVWAAGPRCILLLLLLLLLQLQQLLLRTAGPRWNGIHPPSRRCGRRGRGRNHACESRSRFRVRLLRINLSVQSCQPARVAAIDESRYWCRRWDVICPMKVVFVWTVATSTSTAIARGRQGLGWWWSTLVLPLPLLLF